MRTWRALAFVCGCAFVLGGCGPKNGAGTAGGKNILRYALQNRPTQLDPATVEDGDTIDMLFQVFEGLVTWNERNEAVPNIAEKWEISPDGKTYTFHLRDNVYVHPPFKRKLTANDFVYSLTRALLPATKSPTSRTYLADIAGANEVLAEIVRPATTARIVAKATAEMNAKKTSPPRCFARSGAAMLSTVMFFGVRIVAAPKPRNVVML